MWHSDYQYYATLTARGTNRAADVPLLVDWIPALRCAEFEQVARAGRTPPAAPATPVIEPLWSTSAKAPYVRGVRIRTGSDDDATSTIPLHYFADAVNAAAKQLVISGVLAPGEAFEYRVFALAERAERAGADPAYRVVAMTEQPEIGTGQLSTLLAQAGRVPAGEGLAASGFDWPLPVFIPQDLLDQVAELACRAGDRETGGILVGKLWRDPGGALFTCVTAQIAATHTEATESSLRFTPATWVSVEAAIALRDMGEITLGWWHSHPFFCRNCSTAERARCPLSSPAFSVADKNVHREVFQQPWSIALLLSFLGDSQPSCDVFAWNEGQIDAVEFYPLPGSGPIEGEVYA
jgi:proteasome lid subunit RPN8/RPN11